MSTVPVPVRAYTDYPILALGDIGGKEAPIRECRVLSYDGNKYCKVEVGGVIETIKSGYLYTKAGRCTKAPCLPRSALRRLETAS